MAAATKPNQTPSKTITALDKMALEYEYYLQDLKSSYGYLQVSEKMAGIFSAILGVSTLMPWFSFSAHEPLFGLSAGGGAHLIIALVVLGILHRVVSSRRNAASRLSSEYFSPDRAAILIANAGIFGTLLNSLLLVYFKQWGQPNPLIFQIEPAFYGTLMGALGLVFSGILHFFESHPSSPNPES